MVEVTVYVETEIHPTENEDKVKLAVNNIFVNPIITIKPAFKGSVMTAEARGQDSLFKFRNLLRNDRIRDAARRFLFKSIKGKTILFCLNKQVAFVGHVSFSEETAESPLGPIKVEIETDNPQQLVEWLVEKID